MTQSGDANLSFMKDLIVLARDFLQAHDLKSVIALAAKAMPMAVSADGMVLLVAMDRVESISELDHRGNLMSPHPNCSLVHFAREAMLSKTPVVMCAAPCVRSETAAHRIESLLAIPLPPSQPSAAMCCFWVEPKSPAELNAATAILNELGILVAAALGNASFMQSLQGQIACQSVENNEAARLHADELVRRDGVEKEIHRLSITDVMTGMLNRRGFFLLAEQGFKLAQREGLPSSLIYIDIDGLKSANDIFGHETGDCLIRDVARILQMSFRESDILARLGGDEFAAFALNAGQPQAIMARLRHSIDAFSESRSVPYEISFSTGIVQCDPSSNLNLSDYVSLADQQMYQQKRDKNDPAA